jgi:hypothetical protein
VGEESLAITPSERFVSHLAASQLAERQSHIRSVHDAWIRLFQVPFQECSIVPKYATAKHSQFFWLDWHNYKVDTRQRFWSFQGFFMVIYVFVSIFARHDFLRAFVFFSSSELSYLVSSRNQ